jgi:tripartite-type tricarboxylate transporter receptor subunit TctC
MEENMANGKASWNATRRETVRSRHPAGRGQAAHHALVAAGVILGAVLLVGALSVPLHAQSYPSQPIRFIVPFPPGGATDLVARIVAPKLAERLGQPVVPENRPGAGSHVGTEFVAKARPDGYTLGMVTVDITTGPSLYKKLPYDPAKDLAPLSLLAKSPLMLLVRQTLPAKTLKEFVEYAKANPGKVSYGSSGMGSLSHLAGEMLARLANLKMLHAPYKGAGPALVGLAGGEIDMIVVAPTGAISHIQAGKMRALAALDKERAAALPDVPTSKEAGVDGFEAPYWNAIVAPAGTPRDLVNRLNAEVIKILAMPDVKEQIRKGGVEAASSTPEQLSEIIKMDIARWTKVVKEANVPSLD